MRKQEAVERLCHLVTKVGDFFNAELLSHDCICGENPMATDPVVDEKIILLIEEAVDTVLKGLTSK